MNDHQLFDQVCGAYLEMPGLRLTASQARRLFGLDDHTCQRILDMLVDLGFLRRCGDKYAREAEGRRLRAAEVRLITRAVEGTEAR